MITTRQVNVNLDKGRTALKRTTTKGVDASVKVEQPKEPIKTQSVSTANIADVKDIAEKKRRDGIMAQKKVSTKTDGEKKLVMKEKMVKVRAAKGKKK